MAESYVWYYENDSLISMIAEIALGPGMPRMLMEVSEGKIFGKPIGLTVPKVTSVE